MGYFVPMGLGTISEDGSELVTNKGSGITKAGWGGARNPFRPNNANDGCEVTIFANNEEEVLWELYKKDGVDVSFSAGFKGQGCGQREYSWDFGDGMPISADSAPTHMFTNDGDFTVSLTATCSTCNPFVVNDDIVVHVFLPIVEIKKDEEHENGWFELIGINNDQYYAERTNLKIEMKYPEEHPQGGDVIADYTGNAKIKEDGATNYYNGLDGASELPKDININKGVGKISIDSVSGETENWPQDSKVSITLEDFDVLNQSSIDKYNVKQWVKDSDLNVSENLTGTNEIKTPDWLEKRSWDAVRQYRGANGILGTVVSLARNITFWNTNIFKACGETPVLYQGAINSTEITISARCSNTMRKNVNNNLSKTVVHELRHIWQNSQILARPLGATGLEPINDSDTDTCLEIIGNNTEAGPGNSTPIQDGVTVIDGNNTYVTHGDNNNLNGGETSVCQELWELDAYEFENHVK